MVFSSFHCEEKTDRRAIPCSAACETTVASQAAVAGQLTEFGVEEMRRMAVSVSTDFPELFSAVRAGTVDVKRTKSARTGESCEAFFESLAEPSLGRCLHFDDVLLRSYKVARAWQHAPGLGGLVGGGLTSHRAPFFVM